MRYSWQQCPHCNGVFVVWRDPDAPPINTERGMIVPQWFLHADGTPCTDGEIIRCDTCGATDYIGLHPDYRRYGDRLPTGTD